MVSDLKTFPLAGTQTRLKDLPLGWHLGLDLGKSNSLVTETWRQIWARPAPVGFCSLPFSPDLLAGGGGGHSVSPSRLLPAPGPPPMVRLARERWVWRRRVRCSRAEKRCPAWRAMLQESAVLSAVLDRTMFRFHRSTTWLDQAQRKAPRRLVRVKVRKQRQREDRSAQRKQRGAAEGRAGPHRG